MIDARRRDGFAGEFLAPLDVEGSDPHPAPTIEPLDKPPHKAQPASTNPPSQTDRADTGPPAYDVTASQAFAEFLGMPGPSATITLPGMVDTADREAS